MAFPPQHLAVFGRPGSGKSSIAERLGAEFGYRLIRTGELLREAIRRGDHLGKRVEIHLTQGTLVPDRLIFELLEQCLKAPGTDRLLFDGFPRTLGQVELLEGFERRLGFKTDCFLDIVVSRAEAVARMTGRRVCPQCGTPYHVITRPPRVPEHCDKDGAPLIRRPDDAPEIVEVRQSIFDEHAGPILDHYRTKAPDRYRCVNGEQSPAAVYTETCRVLELRK